LERKAVSGIMMTLLLTSMLTLALNIQPVKASGTIYIRADGSVDPSTAPIFSVDNVTYTFTGDVNDSIVVERGNIIIDGNGYTLQGSGSGNGFYWNGINNVTIKNATVKGFGYGVYLNSTLHNVLSGNNIANNLYGITLGYSSNNSMPGNNITANNGIGIYLYRSSNNSLSGNNITAKFDGISLSSSVNNSIFGNNVRAGLSSGIRLFGSSNNNVYDNGITAYRGKGIWLSFSSNNSICGNNISACINDLGIEIASFSNYNIVCGNNIIDNGGGIELHTSSNNTLRSNIMVNNTYNFGVFGASLPDYVNDVDASNTVDGKPVYYWINEQNSAVPSDAGYVALVNCTRITVQNLSLTKNEQGVILASTTNSTITKNNITDNRFGIQFKNLSNYNRISGNNIANNTLGTWLSYSNNSIYHNSFINNTNQVYIESSVNVWDVGYPSGGNYWSDYTGVDANGDGIGDTPYIIDADNRDRYPLMHPWSSLPVHNINTGLGYATIQEAINANETLNGHTIFVEAGTYYENVIINKTITFMGENRDTTTIDGNETGTIIDVEADRIVIRGFTIQNSGGYDPKGICLIENCEHTTIQNNKIRNNFHGIYICSPSHNNIISGNIITNNMNGIFFSGGSTNNSVFDNNITTNIWSAVVLYYSSNNNSIFDNNVTNNGNGIVLYNCSDNDISANVITNNGYGIRLYSYSSTNGIFDNNITNNGCGVFTEVSSNNIFYHNNLINNTEQVYIYYSLNVWDDGYPSGGNYWSEHTDVDLYHGPFQNETGSDGIWDHPYIIDANNTDRYPLKEAYVPRLGDFDDDRDVDYDDILYFVSAYIRYWSDLGKDPMCDFDKDCDIDYDDILAFVSAYIDYWTP